MNCTYGFQYSISDLMSCHFPRCFQRNRNKSQRCSGHLRLQMLNMPIFFASALVGVDVVYPEGAKLWEAPSREEEEEEERDHGC